MQYDKSNLKMRKAPSQSRSEFTVSIILEAAKRILTERGLEQLTATEVAELAGVSVGSFYQYFPGTEALVAELRRRHRCEIKEALRDAINSSTDSNFEESLRLIVIACVELHAKEPKLHYILTKYNDIGVEASPEEPRFSLVSSGLEGLEISLGSLGGASPERVKIMLRVIYEIVDSLIHAAIIHKELDLSRDDLVGEIMCVVLGYLDRVDVQYRGN